MRRDSIFYALFQRSPSLLFELLEHSPDLATQYRFESVAVKEPKFEIDGVFLPPDSGSAGTIFFAEVQMQKDECLYERLFGESFLYFYRNRQYYSDWQAVVIYPSRSVEQSDAYPYRALLHSDQVHRVYLNELGEIGTLPLGVAAMVLTIVDESEAPEQARMLIGRANQEVSAPPIKQGIIEMVSTIMIYKFTNYSQKEINEMLGVELEYPRAIREARDEGALQQARSLILKQLTRKVGAIPDRTLDRINPLSIAQLESLGEDLLGFETIADLVTWLDHQV